MRSRALPWLVASLCLPLQAAGLAAPPSALDAWLVDFQTDFVGRWKPAGSLPDFDLELGVNHGGSRLGWRLTQPGKREPLAQEQARVVFDALKDLRRFPPLPDEATAPWTNVQLQWRSGRLAKAQIRPKTVFLGLTYEIAPPIDGKPASLFLLGASTPQALAVGFRHGDRVMRVEGRALDEKTDVVDEILALKRPGDTVKFSIERGTQELELSLVLAESPMRLPALPQQEAPRPVPALAALPPSALLAAERVFGWGEVRAVRTQGQGRTVVAVTRQPSAAVLKERTAALWRLLAPSGTTALTVETETGLGARTADGQEVAVEAGQSTPSLRLAAGTFLSVRLDIDQEDGIPQGSERAVTGALLLPVLDGNGVPLLMAGTKVTGRLVHTSPFGHRLVLDSLGDQKTALAAESGVLPTREIFIGKAGGGSEIGNVMTAYASVVHPGQAIGVRLLQPLQLPVADSPTDAPPASTAIQEDTPPNSRQTALELYNRALRAAERSEWEAAIADLRASLDRSASVQARAALGWIYERAGHQWLLRDDPARAVFHLERALALGTQVSTALTLLACAYQRDIEINGTALSAAELQHYRQGAATYGLTLGECTSSPRFLVAERPSAGGGEYLSAVAMYGYGTRNVYVHFTRQPIRVYIDAAPTPELAQLAWDAALTWQRASDDTVQFVRVERPTDADILVYFSDLPTVSYAGLTLTLPQFFNPRAMGNQLDAPQVEINLRPALRYAPEDQPAYIKAVAIHEFGHAIGLFGHSNNIDDLMYYRVSGLTGPSPRDIATLKKLYASPPDITRP